MRYRVYGEKAKVACYIKAIGGWTIALIAIIGGFIDGDLPVAITIFVLLGGWGTLKFFKARRIEKQLHDYYTGKLVPPTAQEIKDRQTGGIIIVIIVVLIIIGGLVLISQNNTTNSVARISPTSTRTRWPTNPPQNTLSFEDYYQKKSTKTPFPTKTKSPNTCQPYRYITLSDVGDTVCVWGIVKKAWYDEQQDAFFMTFGNDPGDLYLIVYGAYYEDIQNHCVQLTGEVKKLGQTPVMTVYNGTMYSCDN